MHTTGFLIWSAVLALASGSIAEERGRLVTHLAAGNQQILVAYGTSLTAYGAWVSQLQQALDQRYPGLATVLNSGQGNAWSKWGLDHLEEHVLRKKPDVVFIEFAINDAFAPNQATVAQARQNLVAMIDRLLKFLPDIEIALMTMNPPTGRPLESRPNLDAFYQMYRDVAKERNLLLIDHNANWKALMKKDAALFKSYIRDGINPSGLGCEKVVTPVLLKALGLDTVPLR